jgi:hypothetical protein
VFLTEHPELQAPSLRLHFMSYVHFFVLLNELFCPHLSHNTTTVHSKTRFRLPMQTTLSNFLAMAMFAFATYRTRRGLAVTAFHFATTSTSTRSASAAPRVIGTFGDGGAGARIPAAFHPRRGTEILTSISNLKLQMSTVAVSAEPEKKMDVEHPSYEIITKDFIEEYGAATTLYRHKKSGAELLSVSTDDDNKVFGITFRTPRK